MSSSTVAVTSPKSYPLIPLPDGIFYQGITIEKGPLEGLISVNFYADDNVYPTESGAITYLALLRQNGWDICTGSKCKLMDFTITDTRTLGVYQYGQEPGSPVLMAITNTMIEPGQQTTLFLKNCGEVKETKDQDLSSSEGCLVLLPDEFTTP